MRDKESVELPVTIDAPITHTSRGFAGHVDLAVPLLHAGINFRFCKRPGNFPAFTLLLNVSKWPAVI
nr:hypothetical protein [Burkholderia pyrrocinia]